MFFSLLDVNSPGISSSFFRNCTLNSLIQGEYSFRFPGSFKSFLIFTSSESVILQKTSRFIVSSLEPPFPKLLTNSFPKAWKLKIYCKDQCFFYTFEKAPSLWIFHYSKISWMSLSSVSCPPLGRSLLEWLLVTNSSLLQNHSKELSMSGDRRRSVSVSSRTAFST